MVTYRWDEQMCRMYADGLRPVVRFDHRRWAAKIASRLPTRRNLRVLDVASGPGFLLLELARHLQQVRLVAQDGAADMLVIAREEAARYGQSLETVECPAEELALADGSVDVVTCKQLLHEANDVDAVLGELRRVLKPGGLAFVIDFDRDGSRLAAVLLRSFLRLQRGKEISQSFWKSFSGGLAGRAVVERMTRVGFKSVDYVRSGPNYMMVGSS